MAVSKVILNGETLMDVTVDTVTSEKLLTGYQATGRDGVKVQGAYVPQSADLTIGSVNPSESSQHVTPPTGYDGFEYVDVTAVPSDYVGSNIARNSAADVTISGPAISIPSGYYGSGVETAIAEGSVVVTRNYASTTIGTVSLDSTTGIVSVTRESADYTTTAYGYAGYITSVTANGTFTVRSAGTSYALSTQAAAVITPTESSQIAVASGKYTLGNIEVAAISSDYVGSAIAQRSSADLSASGAVVSVPSGYYNVDVEKTVASGVIEARGASLNPGVGSFDLDTTTGVITVTRSESTAIAQAIIASAGYLDTTASATAAIRINSNSKTYTLPTISAAIITPTETSQVAAASGKYTLGDITVAAISSDYVGSAVTQNSAADVTISGPTVSIPSGYYNSDVSKAVSTVAMAIPTIEFNTTTGAIQAKSTQAAGYVAAGSTTVTSSLGIITGTTITPTESIQTIGGNAYVDGTLKVGAISSDYVGSAISVRTNSDLTFEYDYGEYFVNVPKGYYSNNYYKTIQTGTAGTPTAAKGTVSNHSVSVTPSVTNTTGYITGGTKTGTAVTVSASELVSGTKNIAANGSGIDVTEYKYVDVNIDSKLYIATISWSSTKHSRTNIKYNNVKYQTEGDTFTFHAGDTAILEAYGEVGGGVIYINNVEVAQTDHNQPYVYTLPANNIDFVLSTNGGGSISGTINDTIEITTNGTHNIEYYTYADVDVQPALQSKIGIVPTESSQIITADSSYDGLSSVQIVAISSDYVGSAIPTHSSADLSISVNVVTVPSGYYPSDAVATISKGRVTVSGGGTVTPTISVSSGGIVTAINSSALFMSPHVVQAGYISQSDGYSGQVPISGSKTYQLSVAMGTTIIPTTTTQTAVATNKYTIGAIQVQGDADLIPANIVEGVSIFGVTGTAVVGVAMTTTEILENAAEGWGFIID